MQYLKVTITIFIISLGVMAIVFYRASARHTIRTDFQIVQHIQTEDYYALFKASEYIANAMAETVASEEFMQKVMTKNPALKELLPQDRQERLRAWRTMVWIDDVTTHGGFSLYVRGDDVEKTRAIAKDVATLITKDNGMYGGKNTVKKKVVVVKNENGDTIEEYEEDDGNIDDYISIRVISGPLLFTRNGVADALFAGLFSVVFSMAFVYFYRLSRVV